MNLIIFNRAFIIAGLIGIILSCSLPILSYAKQLNAFIGYTTFYSPNNGPYVETYLAVDGTSLDFALNENGKYQASIQVLVLFHRND